MPGCFLRFQRIPRKYLTEYLGHCFCFECHCPLLRHQWQVLPVLLGYPHQECRIVCCREVNYPPAAVWRILGKAPLGRAAVWGILRKVPLDPAAGQAAFLKVHFRFHVKGAPAG